MEYYMENETRFLTMLISLLNPAGSTKSRLFGISLITSPDSVWIADPLTRMFYGTFSRKIVITDYLYHWQFTTMYITYQSKIQNRKSRIHIADIQEPAGLEEPLRL